MFEMGEVIFMNEKFSNAENKHSSFLSLFFQVFR